MRQEWGRLVALLLSQFRRLDLVEDALGDAVEAASRTWPNDGVPGNPAAWLMTAARRRVLDRLRTEDVARRKQPLLVVDAEHHQDGARTMADAGSLVEDDVLRLVLICAHPALAPEATSALSLRLVIGVPTADIARLILVPEPTMAARITRARTVTLAGRRTCHYRFNELQEPEKVPLDTDYASVIESDVPIVVQHTRLDSRASEIALLSTIAWPAD